MAAPPLQKELPLQSFTRLDSVFVLLIGILSRSALISELRLVLGLLVELGMEQRE